jgi:hypothetical protein
MAKQRTQRDGVDLLIKAGALPTAAGPMRLPIPGPDSPRPGTTLSENGPCGNPGDWCSTDVFVRLPGWKYKLCGSCEAEWLKAVSGE